MPSDLPCRPRAFRVLPLLAILVAGSSTAAPAETPCRPGIEAAIAAARERVEALRRAAGIPGLAVAVGAGGELVWSQGFGQAELETPAPVTSSTRFRAASVSKLFTVAVLARLAARGAIDLDAPIGRHLPELPASLRAITPRQLAGHLGGIRHYLAKDFTPWPIDVRHFDSLREALELFASDELVAPPGSEYHYSTFGFTLLGATIEAATGRGFPEVLAAEVLRPLGLRHTGIDDPAAIVPGRAGLYDRDRERDLVRARFVDPSYKWSGGGLLTTPEDLVRFGFAHLEDSFLPAALRRQLFTPQTTTGGEVTGVGLGWRIGEDGHGRRIYHHSGSMTGARSSLLVYPDEGLVLALTTNLGGWPPQVETTLQGLAQIFLADTCSPPSIALPLGAFHVVTTLDGARGEGLLWLARDGDRVRGAWTVPAPVAEALAATGAPSPHALEIVGVEEGTEDASLVIAWPIGLLPLHVELAGDGFTGRMEIARRALSLVAGPIGDGGAVAEDGESEASVP